MTKLKAVSIHFFCSLIVLFTFLLWTVLVWYGGVFVELLGLWEPIKVFVMVDLILGPFFTFIVYKQGKKTLRIDMTVIVLFQIMAFIFGAYVLFQGKPSLVVMKKGAFEVLTENQLDFSSLPEEVANIISPFSGPQFVYINEGDFNIFELLVDQQEKIQLLNNQFDQIKDKQMTDEQLHRLLKEIPDENAIKLDEQLIAFLISDGSVMSIITFDNQNEPISILRNNHQK